jgi:hypothetical protein
MALLLTVYFLPILLGAALQIKGLGWVFAVNLLGGWTLLGWVVALWLAQVYREIDKLEEQIKQELARLILAMTAIS